ncbi:unnamed protein product [Bemisia tabaci]|uniref:Uncharacterized protein n=1 Tax=Bemisia tabaci TaxID=7038 RepID=A0A9P0AFY0_BEMTA|nr:unnamed protein product [Bemisia tabaci]
MFAEMFRSLKRPAPFCQPPPDYEGLRRRRPNPIPACGLRSAVFHAGPSTVPPALPKAPFSRLSALVEFARAFGTLFSRPTTVSANSVLQLLLNETSSEEAALGVVQQQYINGKLIKIQSALEAAVSLDASAARRNLQEASSDED